MKIRYLYNVIREYEIPDDALENEKSMFDAIKENPENYLFFGNHGDEQKVTVALVVYYPKENKWAAPPKKTVEVVEPDGNIKNEDKSSKS